MKITCISDTHEKGLSNWDFSQYPARMLIHAGDATARGTPESTRKVAMQLGGLHAYYRWILFVPGNHDKLFTRDPEQAIQIMSHHGVITLMDEGIVIDGIHFYGMPWIEATPDAFHIIPREFLNFTRLDIREYLDKIPEPCAACCGISGVDVLITHQPAAGILDEDIDGKNLGSSQLYSAIEYKIKPRVVISGHVHESHGEFGGDIYIDPDTGYNRIRTKYVNAALLDNEYLPVHQPITIEV